MEYGKTVKYMVMGEDGIYTFEDTWEELPRQLGFLSYCGFTLLGIDGINGFKIEGGVYNV